MCTSVPPHDLLSRTWKTLPVHFLKKLKYRGKSLIYKMQGSCVKGLMANTANTANTLTVREGLFRRMIPSLLTNGKAELN